MSDRTNFKTKTVQRESHCTIIKRTIPEEAMITVNTHTHSMLVHPIL